MNLVILCEGFTEKKILKEFLRPYCPSFEHIEIVTPSGVGGAARLKQEFKKLAETALETDTESIVFCLIDLLQAPFSFPKHIEDDVDPYQARYVYIQHYMQTQIKETLRQRFYAFPVFMELETWLLADVQALKRFFRTNSLTAWVSPESVLKPAYELKILMRMYRAEEYEKVRQGAQLFKSTDAKIVYDDNCPHFVELINKLLEIQGLPSEKTTSLFQIPNRELYEQLASLERQLIHFGKIVLI
jgi:Domain of unknown function (DUF4276)